MLFLGGIFLAMLSYNPLKSFASPSIPEDQSSAVILVYHMIGEDRTPDQSIRVEQFEEQMRELKEEDYNVLSLAEVVDHYKNELALPPRSIVITFDGAHKSVTNKAVPILLQHNFPFTVFVSPDRAGMKNSNYMSWSDIKYLGRYSNITIGMHTASYSHIADEDRSDLLRDINNARTLYRENMGTEPEYFAYPFGEYSAEFREIIKEQSFKAALGQSSGVAYRGSDILALPRFVMTEEYGDLERFRMLANALPLPVGNLSPDVSYLGDRHPDIGFSVTETLEDNLDLLSCFASGQERPHMEIINGNRVELRLQQDFAQERGRINCTMPAPSLPHEEKRWRWFGMLFTYPSPLNSFPSANDEQEPELEIEQSGEELSEESSEE